MAESDMNIIHGRPDFADPYFGVTVAKKHPPYVFSINANAALVHKIRSVELRWWKVGGVRGECLVRLHRPRLIANTLCGTFFFLNGAKSRTCQIPSPEALLCGRCHGVGAIFDRVTCRTKDGTLTRSDAHVKLGCMVAGY